MRRRTISILALAGMLAGAAMTSAAANALNSYLRIAADDAKIEIAGSGWGRVDALRRGEHLSGAPPRGTKACSIVADGTIFPVLDKKANDILGLGGAWLTLTIEDSEGADRTYRFTEVSGFSCNERARICSFDFDAFELADR